MSEYNVYEVTKDGKKKWFYKSLGSDKFTAEVEFYHLNTDFINGHHTTHLLLVEE